LFHCYTGFPIEIDEHPKFATPLAIATYQKGGSGGPEITVIYYVRGSDGALFKTTRTGAESSDWPQKLVKDKVSSKTAPKPSATTALSVLVNEQTQVNVIVYYADDGSIKEIADAW
jgi:hypothetical protein